MADITLNDVIELADQLSKEDRIKLVAYLSGGLSHRPLTLADVQAEHARRLESGAFDNA